MTRAGDRWPRVSFIVLSFNSAAVIERCVRSLVAQMPRPLRDEIHVVDNGSTDGSRQVLRSLQAEFSDVLHVRALERNHGTTVSRNMALRAARGAYVAIVDADVYVPPGTVDGLIRDLDANQDVGLIAPRLVYPTGRRQLSTDRFPTLFRKIHRFFALKAIESRMRQEPERPGIADVDYAISAFWLMRREVVEAVGLLDERIFYSPEDVDYCVRVWKAGYRVAYDSLLTAVHDAQEISRGLMLRPAALSHMKGLLYLYAKHRFILSGRTLRRPDAPLRAECRA